MSFYGCDDPHRPHAKPDASGNGRRMRVRWLPSDLNMLPIIGTDIVHKEG